MHKDLLRDGFLLKKRSNESIDCFSYQKRRKAPKENVI